MSRMVKLQDADRSFDLEFWRKVGPEGRFSAAWEMIREYRLIKGKNGYQPRLRRSVQNIERI